VGEARETVELKTILEQGFLHYDGRGRCRARSTATSRPTSRTSATSRKEDPRLVEKARDRWYVPDPNKQAEREAVREKDAAPRVRGVQDEHPAQAQGLPHRGCARRASRPAGRSATTARSSRSPRSSPTPSSRRTRSSSCTTTTRSRASETSEAERCACLPATGATASTTMSPAGSSRSTSCGARRPRRSGSPGATRSCACT
jgi:hypothetical protein